MTAALDGAQRTALSNLIQKARSLLETDLALTLEGTFGIHHGDGWIEDAEALSLDASQAAVRTDLLDIVAYLRSEGETELAAVERLIREAAFTHANRLVALRVAEGLGHVPEAIGRGLESQGFRDFAEIAPASANEEWERFRLFVRICADELSADVPALFDPRNPLLELEPSTASFSELIGLFVVADETIWSAPDTLGWSYQFFNSAEERREMRESSAPRNSRELAVRNQFFTPSYVVEFLVQNGLGAHLAASYPALVDDLPLLVEVPQPVASPIDLREVSALDPACGSGHFLLGAYDVLEAAWRHAGVEPEDAAPDIVRSLWGIDIDPRATQIAQAAVILRARRHCRAPLPKPNVICARSLPTGPEADDLIAALPPQASRVVRAIADELVMAPVLGPLLKIEERLDREARDAFGTGRIEGTLSEGLSEDETANVESLVLEALATIADQTTSTVSQRLFAADAHDAVRFVEAMSRRYTACLMNPPFGDPIPTTRQYLKAGYPANSTRTADLFASFVDRGRSLCEDGGSVAAITTRAGLFLQSYERWRREVFLANESIVLADLGFGIMEQAMVEAAAYVLARPSVGDGRLLVISVLDRTDRPTAVQKLAKALREKQVTDGCYAIRATRLSAIPGSRVAYWAGEGIGAVFEKLHPIDSGDTKVRRGIQTGDDFRFLRLDWEVGRLDSDSRWQPLAKGGRYSPYLPDTHLLVDWRNGGSELIAFEGSIVPSTDLYFSGGVTWSRRTNSAFGPRLLEFGTAFSDKGPGIVGGSPRWHAAYLNTRLARSLVETMVSAGESTTSGSASRSYDTGLVGRVPVPDPDAECESLVSALWASLVDLRNAESWGREPMRDASFQSVVPNLMDAGIVDATRTLEHRIVNAAVEVIEAADALDTAVLRIAAIQAEVENPVLEQAVEAVVGPSVARNSAKLDHKRLHELWRMDMDDLIDLLIEEFGGSRNVANLSHLAHRRLEVICHALSVSPRSVADALRDSDVVSPDLARQFSVALLAWLGSTSFGAMAEVPMVTGPGALMSQGPRAWTMPSGEGLLVDDPFSEKDFARRFVRSAGEHRLTDLVRGAQSVVGWMGSVEANLRRRFFGLHLGLYSMSRRKAPVLWQLQVPSKVWGVWLYFPQLSREMLFAVVREAASRKRFAEQRIATLQREYEDGGAGRSIAAVSKEIAAEQKLAIELVTFRDEAQRIATLGWEPDLDDGAVLNAAPLASLFPAWKDAAKYRKELRQGKHTWSTVSKYAEYL